MRCVLLLVLLAACGGEPFPAQSDSVAIYDVRAVATDMLAVPFPSEVHRDAAGAITLGDIPGARGGPAFDALREMIAARSGFCTTCGAYFAIDGALDADTLPVHDAEVFETPTLDDPVLLVDIDEDSPDQGRLLPLRVHYDPSAGIVAVRLRPGSVLARNRSYAVALTARIAGGDGLPLAAANDFVALRDGDAANDAVEAVRPIVAPAIDAVVDLGVPRDMIVALSPFTTGDSTEEVSRVRALVRDGPAPVAAFDRVWSDDALDSLLGVPAAAGPGIDGPPASGAGSRAISHASTAFVVTGSFDASRIVSGSGTDVGVPLRGPNGDLVAGPAEPVPFVLLVPRDADVSRLPVVLSLHGFNSSRAIAFALADTAGPEGVAVLAIDYYQHGERAESREDARHAMRGDFEGADGFAETSPLDVSARVFGVTGVTPGTELSPRYARGSLLQFASDAMSALRFLREGDLASIREAVPELATLSFDPGRVYLVGNSLGAEVATFVLAVEDGVAGAVLNVPPGSIVDNLVESPEFRPLTETLFLPLLGITGPFVEPERGLSFDLVIDLYRSALESVDPLALAPHLLRDRIAAGDAPELVLQLGAFDEVAAPVASEAMVAALGVETSSPLTLARADEVVAGAPAIAHRLPGGHGMLEIRSQESRYEPPAVPPFRPRRAPMVVENPIVEVHRQIAELIRSERL